MHYRIVLPVVIFILCTAAFSNDLQREEQLVWDYGEFVQEFSARNWTRAARYVSLETKVGFGGAAGMEGVAQVFGSDNECHRAMVHALESGCRKIGEGDSMHCVSPPYSGPDVVYLGARASFRYSAEAGRWMLVYLICGGD